MSTVIRLAAQIPKLKGQILLGLAAAMVAVPSVYAQGITSPFEINSFGDARLRYQIVDEEAFERSAEILSLRIKLGFELDIFENATALIEFEGSENFIEDFNDGLNGKIDRPAIGEPDSLEINRLQFQTYFTQDTRLTLGRQTIAIDDWRFIGQWDFRQNEQTFDAVRLESKIGPGILDAAYVGRVHRQFGDDSPIGEFDGDSFLLNYGLQTPLGRVSAFYYGLDLETGPEESRQSELSSATTGVRVNGRYKWTDWGLTWDGSLARQTDFADNPNEYAAIYRAAKLGVEYRNFDFAVKSERLGSDNGQAVQTPLGTLHRLNGAADQFLTTPDEGLDDLSLSAGYKFRQLGIFEDVRTRAAYHWFDAATGNASFGKEFDVSLSGKWKNFRFGLEYADYNADSFSSDTQTFIFSTEFDFD